MFLHIVLYINSLSIESCVEIFFCSNVNISYLLISSTALFVEASVTFSPLINFATSIIFSSSVNDL